MVNEENNFKKKFHKLTNYLFNYINYDNLLIVGDSVFYSFINNKININNLKYFDIKIYFYDLDKNCAIKKLKELFLSIKNSCVENINFTLNDDYFIIYSKYPFRNIRINLNLLNQKLIY